MQKEIVFDKKKSYVEHQFIKKNLVISRNYQVTIAKTASKQNTLVVLPTALGKTIIALLSLVEVLTEAPNSKILIMAPTRPLVMQHYASFKKFLTPKLKCCLISSNMSPVKRAYALNGHDVFFSTPQIIQNDIKAELYDLSGFSQVIFDEGHKARKKYAYTYVANSYFETCKHPLTLALTASPGKNLFRINELCRVLKIERIISKTEDDYEVSQYTHSIDSIVKRIDLPNEIAESQIILETAIRKIKNYLMERELLPHKNYTSKFIFIQLMQDMKMLDLLLDPYLNEEDKVRYDLGEHRLNFPHLLYLFKDMDKNSKSSKKINDRSAIISKAINGIYLEHLKELLSTQSVKMFWNYYNKLQDKAKYGHKGLKTLLNSQYMKVIVERLKNIDQNPKFDILKTIIQEEIGISNEKKMIIFANYREMGQIIETYCNSSCNVISKRFVGQSSRSSDDHGMNQKEQAQVIRDFSVGKFNVLIATSVAEEGLDIPNVDTIVFYDAVPSEIRLIQRKGRTGRHRPGKCYYLVYANTLDDIYHAVSHKRKEKMQELLRSPGAVETCDDVERSEEKPKFKNREMEEITSQFKSSKERKNMQILKDFEKIEDILKQRRKETNSGKSNLNHNTQNIIKVNDYTEKLTQMAQNRLKKSNYVRNKKNIKND